MYLERKFESKKRLFLTSDSMEMEITTWFWDIYERKVFVWEKLIQQKALKIQILFNQQLSEEDQINMQFSRLEKLKKR